MENQYSAININMPRAKLSLLQKNTYIYQIDVSTRWGKWHLEKKYADFADFHKNVKDQFDNLPKFPSRFFTFFLSQSQADADQNCQAFQQYLRIISRRKDIVNTSFFTQFLQLNKHSPQMLANKPKQLKFLTMQQRINDSGKVILDFYYNQNYIVFATGNDSPVQRLNSLVANTKFPWQSDQELQFVLPLGTVECWLLKQNTTGQPNNDYCYRRVWARNYPIQTRKLIFNPLSLTMVVGLADGGVQVFRLYHKPKYVYYEVIKLLQIHQGSICGMHLDEMGMIAYTASTDGWISVVQTTRAILLDQMEANGKIESMLGDSKNTRLYVALESTEIQIFEYTSNGKMRCIHALDLKSEGSITCMVYDHVRKYLFAGVHETGKVYVFEIGGAGSERLAQQVGVIENKNEVVDLVWDSKKMELMVSCKSGEIFFWDMLKAAQIYMLKPYEEKKLSKSYFIQEKNVLIIASRGRTIKFFEMPKVWRDVKNQNQEENQLEIRRKVNNLYKTREALKRKMNNSDQDDLKGWHWKDQQDSN